MEKIRSKPQCHQLQTNNRYQGGKRQSKIIANPRTTFKEEFPELEWAYFDFSTGYRVDMYETSILLMSGFVARKYDKIDDIKIILNELEMPILEKPEYLDSMEDEVDK